MSSICAEAERDRSAVRMQTMKIVNVYYFVVIVIWSITSNHVFVSLAHQAQKHAVSAKDAEGNRANVRFAIESVQLFVCLLGRNTNVGESTERWSHVLRYSNDIFHLMLYLCSTICQLLQRHVGGGERQRNDSHGSTHHTVAVQTESRSSFGRTWVFECCCSLPPNSNELL